jgi:hypothetical protein
MNDSKFTNIKKILAFLSGGVILWASIVFSKNGFEFEITSGYSWVGWSLALAATCAEFMLNSSFKKFNWTIVFLGVCAYAYSIYTNMLGFQSLRTGSTLLHPINVIGALFMDIYPEVAIAWALEESKVGDLLGNLIKTAQNPQSLTQTGTTGQYTPQKPLQTPVQANFMANLPKRETTDIPDFMRKSKHNNKRN